MKKLKHIAEATGAYILFYFFRLLPVEVASNLGASLAKTIGPKLKPHKTALYNIRKTFPDADERRISEIAMGMWDNIGRTAAELPHMPHVNPDKVIDSGDQDIAERAGKTFFL